MKKFYLISAIIILCASLLSLSSCSGDHTHEYGEWDVTIQSTCENDGSRERSCSCGEVEREIIPAGHTSSKWFTVKEATCTADGERTRGCTKCGKELDREALPAFDHSCE